MRPTLWIWAVIGFVFWAAVPAVRAGDTFARHVVAAQEAHAADVGRNVLRAGGNAIDAAVATAFALAVTVPEAGNLGGGGFLVAYLADRREVVTVDFRETAPRSASPRMYLDGDGKPRHRAGAWAAGVPGTVRGLGLAHARWGKLAWADLVQPAARLARAGFPVSADLAGSLNNQLGEQKNTKTDRRDDRARLADFTESVTAFARPDRAAWKAGDRLIQSDLAATLERIAAAGPDEFYTGRTAQLISRYMEEKDGRITAEDLAAYHARLRPPVHTTFRGCDVWSMGPPSSGGVVLCQMLNILDRFDLKADGAQASRTVHRITEAMRRAFFTRAESLGDPDFVPVPTDELVSKAAADKLARSISDRATPSASLAPFAVLPAESDHTTHFSTIDAAGNAVALNAADESLWFLLGVVFWQGLG
ncbi:MAG TPA: gamma-glutamyltransferase, partial [Isosphaeraceae bacterium]|nr:gamma-glutamyltransferase [Isosphaeraceae bacterium]